MNNVELIGRFSNQRVYKEIEKLAPDTRQFSIGVTKYFWEHAFKLQMEFSFDQQYFFTGSQLDSWYLRFQLEIGI
jgi:phosphate-selective porin OprO and OprP